MGFIARCGAGYKLQFLDARIRRVALCVELKYIANLNCIQKISGRGERKRVECVKNINLNFKFQHFHVGVSFSPWFY